MSESIDAKADRYLVGGRVAVKSVSSDRGVFHVYGSDDEPYKVHYSGEWTCTCPARVLVCAHIRACQKISKFDAARKVSLNDSDDEMTKLLSEALKGK